MKTPLNSSRFRGCIGLILITLGVGFPVAAQAQTFNLATQLDACNVSWSTPGPTSAESMPIGNGDIGLNVWTEANGDLNFYIGKTDAWNENVHGSTGLLKLGAVKVSLSPRPSVTPFTQVLKLRTGEILIQQNTTTLKIWVDANNPVVRVEAISPTPVTVTATLNQWRPASAKDVVMTGQGNRIAWYHRNPSNADPHLANLTFGAVIKGAGLTRVNDSTLASATPATSQVISIYPLTATTATPALWLTQLEQKIAQVDLLNLEATRTAHQTWWNQFWNRSWIFVRGDAAAAAVNQGYALQRFITACGGRGAFPIKFNGSIFVVDNPVMPDNGTTIPVTADYRSWGGQYWFQNTRLMYWPRLAAGDFDLMKPLFNMYAAQITPNAAQVSSYYGHSGAYFAETAPFWGGLSYWGPEVPEDWTGHYFSPILELSAMMLEYYDYTGDATFAQQTLLPVAKAGIQFYDQHFTRDAQGKLLIDPVNSIETYWKVHNPAPDIAGLRAVLTRLIALPPSLVDTPTRNGWVSLLAQIPPLPTGVRAGKDVFLPYTGPQTAPSKNGENPELYSVYPFRLQGLGKPDFQRTLNSFNLRRNTFMGGWSQDPVHAAMAGQAEEAKTYVAFNFNAKDPRQKFPAFWMKQHDYPPNQCTGGNGEMGLQQMLMQVDGQRILLLPAWPQGWEGDFKLNAPFNTTVQGSIIQGRVTGLVVTPSSRAVHVVDLATLSTEPPFTGFNLVGPQDAVAAIKQTVKGAGNVLAVAGDFGGSGGTGEQVTAVRDGNTGTKYFNKAQHGSLPKGVNSGFVITPQLGASILAGFQIAAANDVPNRDPLTVTIEGSNAANADQAGGNGFTLLYEGQSGLLFNPDRNSWGLYGRVNASTAYKSYRILITSTAGGSAADAVQYSEIRLLGSLQTPLAGTNIVTATSPVISLKNTLKGAVNVLAVSDTDHSAGQSATTIRDNNLNTKYYNKAKDGDYPAGANTGFVITPSRGSRVINGFQFGTGNDMPARDPMTITIEGSNAANAGQAGGNGFVLIYQGTTGLLTDPGRTAWGEQVNFLNGTAYTSYRILVTEMWDGGNVGAQYSEVKLFANP